MISKQPKSTDSTEIAARLGTDRYKRLTVDTNQTLGSEGFAAFRLNLMRPWQTTPGRDQTYKRRWGVAPSLTLGMNGPTRLTLSFPHQTDDNPPDFRRAGALWQATRRRLAGVPFRLAQPGQGAEDSVQRAHRQARARLLGRPRCRT